MKILPLLSLLLVGACGFREDGVRLHLSLDLRAPQAGPDAVPNAGPNKAGERQFRTARGDHITLTRARVTLGSVEIVPCAPSAAWRWLRALSPVGTAHAHSASLPQRLGTPHVGGLELADGAPLELGTLEPPPDRYCRAHLVFAPADADAEGLDVHPDMEGRTVVLEGEWTPAEGGAPRPFRVESAGVFNADVALDPVSLTPESLEDARTLHLAYDQWLDGVDPGSAEAPEQVLRNVARAVTIGP